MRPNKTTRAFLPAVALAVSLLAGAARAEVIYSNLGEGDSFDTANNWSVVGSNPTYDVKITPTGSDYRLDKIEVAASGVCLFVYLQMDNGGVPGTTVEYWFLPAGTVTATPQLVSATSLARPPLKKGVTYWVKLGNVPDARLYYNNTGALGLAIEDYPNPWMYSESATTPAIRVSGTPILPAVALPEPAGSIESEAADVNTAGQVAGTVGDANGDWASLWSGGACNFLDVPGDGVFDNVLKSYARKINSQGQVLGETWDVNGFRAFFWKPATPNSASGAMIDIGVAEAGDDHCSPIDLNDAGQVLASSYGPPSNQSHSFIWTEGTTPEVLTWADPVSGDQHINVRFGDINDNGQVVGACTVYPRADFPAVLWQKVSGVPMVTPLTSGVDCSLSNLKLNNAGQVAGDMFGAGLNPWFYTGGTLKTIDVKGKYPELASAEIKLADLSEDGRVLLTAVNRMFVWHDDADPNLAFTEIPLGGLQVPGASGVTGSINAAGQVAGNVNNSAMNRDRRSFFWDPANPTVVRELGLLPGHLNPYVLAISDAGLIAGYSYVPTAAASGNHACTWNAGGEPDNPPVITVPSNIAVVVGTPISFTATATDPDAGDTLAFRLGTDPPADAAIDPSSGAFTWTPAATGTFSFGLTVTDARGLSDEKPVTVSVLPVDGTLVPVSLGILPGFTSSIAEDINAAGMAVGTNYLDVYVEEGGYWDTIATRAFVWKPGAAASTALPLLTGYTDSTADFVNDAGQILGKCDNGLWNKPQSCLWEKAGGKWTVTGLGFLPGTAHDYSEPYGINASGQVVGESRQVGIGDSMGFIWDKTSGIQPFTNLPDGPEGPSPTLYPAYTNPISDTGLVVGMAMATSGWHNYGVIWDSATKTATSLGTREYAPKAVSPSGLVAGSAYSADGSQLFLWNGARTDKGRPAVIRPLPEAVLMSLELNPTVINDSGKVLLYGYAYWDFNGDGDWEDWWDLDGDGELEDAAPEIDWVWANDTWTELSTILPAGVKGAAYGDDINAAGQVVLGVDDGSMSYVGLLWDGAETTQFLPSLGGCISNLWSLNGGGLVAGATTLAGREPQVACVWGAPAPTNHLPVLNDVPASATIDEMAEYTFTASATDEDGGALIYFLDGEPSGASIDPSTGAFTWTPTEERGPGEYTFTVSVTDDTDTTSQNITLTVSEVNVAPTLTVQTSHSGTAGASLTFTATADDPDLPANTLTFSLSGAPSGASIVPSTGVFTWTPTTAGTFDFNVVVSDGTVTDTKPVTITVANPVLTVAVTSVTRNRKTGITTVKGTLTNPGTTAATDTSLTSATLAGSATTTRLPLRIGTVKPRSSKNFSLQFKGVSPGSVTLDVQGTCSLGSISYNQKVTVPS